MLATRTAVPRKDGDRQAPRAMRLLDLPDRSGHRLNLLAETQGDSSGGGQMVPRTHTPACWMAPGLWTAVNMLTIASFFDITRPSSMPCLKSSIKPSIIASVIA